MNSIDRQYIELLYHILNYGIEKQDRTGTGTKSSFGWQIRHNMKDGFPLLTTKKMAWKTMVTELLWFLRGDTNIKFLVDNGCNIWDGDAYKNYLERYNSKDGEGLFTKEEFVQYIKDRDKPHHVIGELGPIYGKQWRSWFTHKETGYWAGGEFENNIGIDQIANLINELKTNPDSRRLMVSAWNVGELDQMVLPPCHYGFQVYTRELSLEERFKIQMESMTYSGPMNFEEEYIKDVCDRCNVPTRAISLMFNMRSNDVPLGLPFNLASYGLLLEILAKHVNMVPDELITSIGDAHIYLNQIDGIKEQLTRTPYKLPTVKISDRKVNDIAEYEIEDFVLENYQYHPIIKMPLSN